MLRAGESGLAFGRTLFTSTSLTRLIPIASGITTLAGLLLYATGSHTRFTTLGNIVLGVGALAGLAATIHGGAVTGRATRVVSDAFAVLSEAAPSLADEAAVSLRGHLELLASHSRISLILMVVALLGMASARYL
jgi:hypothetical protein